MEKREIKKKKKRIANRKRTIRAGSIVFDLNKWLSSHSNKCFFRWRNKFKSGIFFLYIVLLVLNFHSVFRFYLCTQITAGWICCMPCVWLRTSATVHKIALTTATLLVTSLLVASPVLFLLSTAPSQLPKDCNAKSDVNCVSTRSVSQTPECNTFPCRQATISILARSNWKVDPCKDFATFSCGSTKSNVKAIKSVQEGVDTLMQRKYAKCNNKQHHQHTISSFCKTQRIYTISKLV